MAADKDLGHETADPGGRRRRWYAAWPALLAGWLVLGTLIAGAGWLTLGACGFSGVAGRLAIDFCPAPVPEPSVPQAAVVLGAEQARTDILERDLERLQLALATAEPCPPPPEPEPELEPEPEPEPQPDIAQVADDPPPQAPEPQRPDTPPTCPVADPTEVILVVDTSGSMQYSYTADPALERRIQDLIRRADQLERQAGSNPLAAIMAIPELAGIEGEIRNLERRLLSAPGPDRMTVARGAAIDLVDALPNAVTLSMLTFNSCTRHSRYGPYSSAERGALRSQLRGLRADGGTPLAHTIAAVARETRAGRSPDQPINVVLFSDGYDSCDGDPCAAARRLRSEMPYAPVSVVAVSANLANLRCVAEATGGLFLEPQSADRIGEAVRQAAGQERPPGCP